MDEMTEKFNKLLDELKALFTVSQAMAINSFLNTVKGIDKESDEKKTIDINQIHQLGLMLTATTENDTDRLVAIVNCLKSFI